MRNDGNAEILRCNLRDRQADAVYGNGAFFDDILQQGRCRGNSIPDGDIIFADLAQYDSIKTGQNRAGMFFAARNFANKMCQAIVVIACSLLLGKGADGTGAATSAGVRNTALVAMIFVAISVVVYIFYNDKEITAAIKAHNEAQETENKNA